MLVRELEEEDQAADFCYLRMTKETHLNTWLMHHHLVSGVKRTAPVSQAVWRQVHSKMCTHADAYWLTAACRPILNRICHTFMYVIINLKFVSFALHLPPPTLELS